MNEIIDIRYHHNIFEILKPRIAYFEKLCYNKIKRNARWMDMDIANVIKELRASTGMTRKAFSEHTGIPVRTLEDWEAGRRTPPEYIPRLIGYQLKYEQMMKAKEEKTEADEAAVEVLEATLREDGMKTSE